jgi:hypothetical protein
MLAKITLRSNFIPYAMFHSKSDGSIIVITTPSLRLFFFLIISKLFDWSLAMEMTLSETLPTVWTGRHVFFLDRQVLIGWLGP